MTKDSGFLCLNQYLCDPAVVSWEVCEGKTLSMLILSPILIPQVLLSTFTYEYLNNGITVIYVSNFFFCKIMFLFCRSQRIASLKLKFLTWIIESRDTIWWKYYSDSQFCTILIDHVQFNNETRNKAEADKLQKMYPNGCHWEFFNILCGNIFIVFLYFLFSLNLLYSGKISPFVQPEDKRPN